MLDAGVDAVLDLPGGDAATDIHCLAIASAIPANVLLRFFHLSFPGGSLWTRFSLPSTTSVGVSGGRFFSHRHVDFVSP